MKAKYSWGESDECGFWIHRIVFDPIFYRLMVEGNKIRNRALAESRDDRGARHKPRAIK